MFLILPIMLILSKTSFCLGAWLGILSKSAERKKTQDDPPIRLNSLRHEAHSRRTALASRSSASATLVRVMFS